LEKQKKNKKGRWLPKHRLFRFGSINCNDCPFKNKCEFYSEGKACPIEIESCEKVTSVSEAQEKIMLLLGQEIIRIITRLKIALKFKQINLDAHARTLSLAIRYLALTEKFLGVEKRGAVKSLAERLAELKK